MDNLVHIQQKRYTSRTAVLTSKTCMYKRYLMFHAGGGGYTTERISLDLLIGTCVHKGLQYLLEHCRIEHPNGDFEEACIDSAVAEAYIIWREELAKKELWLHSGEEERLDWILVEQECLFEGLIRAWAFYRLPELLENFEILEVEKEEVFEDFSPLVTFLGKADYLAREKSTNRVIIGSFKTASQYAEVTTRDILHDMQGVSEWYLVQDRLSRAWKYYNELLNKALPEFDRTLPFSVRVAQLKEELELAEQDVEFYKQYHWMKNFNTCPKVFAVQYEYLLKGQRKQEPYNSGIYKQQSFLCHPLKTQAMQRVFMGSAGGSVIDPDEYKWIHNKKGPLPKGLEKIDVWNDVGIKNWITMLNSGQIQPEEGHPFAKIIIIPDLVLRGESELEEWLISTQFSEEEIALHLDILNSIANDAALDENIKEERIKTAVWQFFPKNSQNCHSFYGRDCPFVFHCWEFTAIEDAINAGNLQHRIPHHDLELKSHIEKGLIENGNNET